MFDRTSLGIIFALVNACASVSDPDTAANDAVHEAWFARVYPLSAVRSRNFLVHGVGEVVQTNKPTGALSTARRVFQIYMAPVRGPSGLTTNNSPRILATWDL